MAMGKGATDDGDGDMLSRRRFGTTTVNSSTSGDEEDAWVEEDVVVATGMNSRVESCGSSDGDGVASSGKEKQDRSIAGCLCMKGTNTSSYEEEEGDVSVSYTHLRAHETPEHLVCRLLLEKKKKH
eukprot:TRINITY_DN6569_c0_g1_i2.p1 TRINITY_DN6569_c0_g1~~TRINITY_DN6569_c0_g1_i2.p1  ORF type:complete len:126 (+),score=29.85 TRINITY_DN6569_c0_g1_i2:353-730(+)